MIAQITKPPRKKKILAIDDDGLVRKSIELFLKKAGYVPTVARGGVEGLAFLAKKRFDLVITDIRMPEMDGLQVIRAVRDYYAQKNKPVIPTVVLTAYNDEPVKESAMKMGVRDFVLKPFKLEDFSEVLERCLGPN